LLLFELKSHLPSIVCHSLRRIAKATMDSAAAAPDDAGTTTATTSSTGEDESWIVQRDALKAVADDAFRLGDFATAIQEYTAALSLDPTNGTLLSNRSAAYLKANQKSKALADAKACVETNTMGNKGLSRYASALQALGRWEAALAHWTAILTNESTHAAALKGKEDCERMMMIQQQQQEEKAAAVLEEEVVRKKDEQQQQQQHDAKDGAPGDDLDDFFNDVEVAADSVVKEKLRDAHPEQHIQNHKTSLGTAADQVHRLIPNLTTYKLYNLNPFHVLDLPHNCDEKEISRRYKALSLLLHPDKNPGLEHAQLAFDQVLAAKELLDDPDKASHIRELVEQGLIQGKKDYQAHGSSSGGGGHHNDKGRLADFQKKAVHKLFADLEIKRREVEQRERAYQQREQQQEDDVVNQERNERKFDKKWKQEERVDNRVGSWRTFQKTKKKKV
jgi:DnaJ homolog subfamily C member 8